MARPPKPPEEKSTSQLGVRLTDEQRAELDAMAEKLDVPAAEVIRIGLKDLFRKLFRKGRK
jgi:hypothetical protein